MKNLTKKYVVVYSLDNIIILKEYDNTGHVYPGLGTLYFETDDLQEFETFINDNGII